MVLLAAVAIPIDLPFFMAFSWFSWVLVGFICLSCQLKEGVAGCCDLLVGTTPFRHNNYRKNSYYIHFLEIWSDWPFRMVALLSTSIRKKVLLVAAVGWLSIDPRLCFATKDQHNLALPNQLFLLDIPTELTLFHESTRFSYKLWFFRASFLRGIGFMILSWKYGNWKLINFCHIKIELHKC